jgi:hypothetical protein
VSGGAANSCLRKPGVQDRGHSPVGGRAHGDGREKGGKGNRDDATHVRGLLALITSHLPINTKIYTKSSKSKNHHLPGTYLVFNPRGSLRAGFVTLAWHISRIEP